MKFEDVTPITELYHQADVLLIDNLQYISGKVASLEELFNILDRRLLQNKQIVFVGDNDFERIPGLGIELLDCLSEGLYQGCFGAIREKVREKEKPAHCFSNF